MKKYKYIHLLWGKDVKFSGPLVKMIINSPDYFDVNEHLFVTPYKVVKDHLPSLDSIILDKNDNCADLINKYSENCDWLFSHGLSSNVYKIRRKYLKKIIWRTWGGSRQRSNWDIHHPFHSIRKKSEDFLYYIYMRYSYGCSPVIGIANVVDILDLSQWNWHKRSKLFPMPYVDSSIDEIIGKIVINKKRLSKISFLLGHQGEPGENHIKLLRTLLSYKNDFNVYIPLSYGDEEYIEIVKKEIEKINDNRIIVLDYFLPLEKYLDLLANIDIAILDEKNSMALGNIAFLLYFRKKIYLNDNGIIRQAFDLEKQPYGITSDIGKKDYYEIIEKALYNDDIISRLEYRPFPEAIKTYQNLFSYLDFLKKNG